MKKKEVILTIAIPTYNRCELLIDQLEEIYNLNSINEEIEILVSDNCSTDDTAKMLRKFGDTHLFFRHIRNDVNIGFDGNILALYKAALGKHIWFLSDDDRLIAGSINYIFNRKEDFVDAGLIVVPHLVRGNNIVYEINDLIPYYPIGEKVPIKIGRQAKVYNEKQRLNLLLLSAQISGCIVSKLVDIDNYYSGGGLMHSKIANLNLLSKPYYYVVDRGLVVSGSKEYFSGWFMESTLFGIRKLYTDPVMKFSKAVADIVSIRTCQYGLKVLKRQYSRPNVIVNYHDVDKHLVAKLQKRYGDRYNELEHDVKKALFAKKMKWFYRFLVFPLVKVKRWWTSVFKKKL